MSQVSRTYGHIPGVNIGDKFPTRADLTRVGLHGQIRAGIHGDPDRGAFSICMSGGYEEDRDMGEKIIYVGAGGRDEENKRQISDQSWDDPGNKSLLASSQTKLPVRVIRGSNVPGYYAPLTGFRYDGLYVVDSATMRKGSAGFDMCFFELKRMREEGDSPLPHRRRINDQTLRQMRRNTRAS